MGREVDRAQYRFAAPTPAEVSGSRAGLRSEGWDPTAGTAQDRIGRRRPDQVWPWSGSSPMPLRYSCAWLVAHEKALPHSRQGDHQVPRTGLEPAQPFGHHPLKVACLPISPPGQGAANIAACSIHGALLFQQAGCKASAGRKRTHQVHARPQQAQVQFRGTAHRPYAPAKGIHHLGAFHPDATGENDAYA